MDPRILKELAKPFHPSHIIWKPGAVKGNRALAMPYADLRAYMNRLDEVCGDGWEVAYEPWGAERIICRLTIGGVERSSTGETTAESEKSEIGGTVAEAQAFKRAAAMFGLGRYLYNLPSGWADYDPASRKFTDQAKAKLTGILVQHYRRATEGKEEPVSAPITASAPEDESAADDAPAATEQEADFTPAYKHILNNLTGKPHDFVAWSAKLHKTGEPCTPNQYQFLTGIIDSLTEEKHGEVLSILCQSNITKENVPSRKVAEALLDILPEFFPKVDASGKSIKGADGKIERVKNPKYRADVCDIVIALAKQPQLVE